MDTTKLPNPFMGTMVMPRLGEDERTATIRDLVVKAVIPTVGDAKARLWYAQQSLHAYRIMLGGAERAIKIGDLRYPPQSAYMTTLRSNVARHEAKVCAALDRLWLAQENAS